MIWSKEESLSREELNKLQTQRLKRLCKVVYGAVPFYKRSFEQAGIKPADIKTLSDLKNLPFTKKADLRDHYPFGLLAEPMDKVIRIHASTGTTGKPTVAGYTRGDVDLWSEVMARTFTGAGVTSADIVQVAYGYGLFTGGLGAHYGAERIGAAVVPMSGGNTQKQIMLLEDFGGTAICCTPSFMLYLYDTAREMKVNFSNFKLRVGLLGAEPWTHEMRREIEEKLRIKAINIYGLSEIIGPGVSFECVESQNGLHVNEDHFYPEIIDPKTGEQLPDGEEGELVITTLTKEAMPLIRYRTGDLTSLERRKCACGRTTVTMAQIKGRSDDMLIIRGVNVFPSQVESVLLSSKDVAPHYHITIDKKGRLDEITVQVEITPECLASMTKKVLSADLKSFVEEERDLARLRGSIQKNIKDIIGVNACVTLMPPGSLHRSEGKAKRVTDKRPK
ncbi:MAG: phenylacetate--CoA ligase [Nitrospirota bacterium]